jgi:peptidoglycan hydrolase-like protein with peptidoglycan-binding domain
VSYVRKGGEFAGYGGVGSTAAVNTVTGDDGVRIIQTQLQRLGFLAAGAGPTGVDGKWGVRTESAMRAAAQYVGYTAPPYSVAGTTITVPDDLMNLIQNAPPPALQQVQTIVGTPPSDGGGLITPATADSTVPPPGAAAASGSTFPWMPVLLVGGGLIGIAAVVYMSKRKYPLTVPEAKTRAVSVPAGASAKRHSGAAMKHSRGHRHAARRHARLPKETIRIY